VSLLILTVSIDSERDVVLARQRTRQLAVLLGFEAQDQTRLATAVSEIARNAYAYARKGKIEFRLEGSTAPQVLVVRVADEGPGIADLSTILEGRYRSATGMGIGIIGARRLMDHFHIETTAGRGTTVELKKTLPRRADLIRHAQLGRLTEDLARRNANDPLEEVQRQNQELLRALDELARRQDELSALNRELEDTNRGVVALYAELEEKADHLRRADELKSRFLSNMTHEFRTPVNSILALVRMLLERSDGDLSVEQERQVTFIRQAADALAELVNDLLDLAKVEAGKTVVRPIEFDVEHLFGALRGMLRPLLVNESVALVFEEPATPLLMHTDEAKVSQILRNFISNALKFTERGEVRISAELIDDGHAVALRVSDSGIGIAPEDQERIFQEFAQIDSPMQRRVRGTGLGLPLCRRLAELLGGSVSVDSRVGCGATFTAVIPVLYGARAPDEPEWHLDADRLPVLVVEDSPESQVMYERMLSGSLFQVLAARTLREAHLALAAFHPRAVILDLLLRGEDSWGLLAELKRRPETHEVPILVISTLEDQSKAIALGADAYCSKPIDRQTLLRHLLRLVEPENVTRVLVVDDEEIFRYVLRQHFVTPRHAVFEAASGREALQLAQAEHPDVICLDLMMPDVDGYEVLRQLKDDPATRGIPVVVITSKALEDDERRQLMRAAFTILPKDRVSREDAIAAVDEALRSAGAAA